MPFRYEPEIARELEQRARTRRAARPAPGDPLALRTFIDSAMTEAFAAVGETPDVVVDAETMHLEGERDVALRWYAPRERWAPSAVVYAHGGGMIAGTLPNYDRLMRQYVQWTGVPFVNVDYSLAPEGPPGEGARDLLAAVRWLAERGEARGVDAGRIAVMGDSGGGGIAAAAAVLARDEGVHVARQILIYPMLDDRTAPDPHLVPLATWSYDDNRTAWDAVVAGSIDGVTPDVVPARNSDYSRLADAYLEVGSLDIFRDETIRYALALLGAGVEAELHVHPGAPHDHDWLAPFSPLADRWRADRIRVIRSL